MTRHGTSPASSQIIKYHVALRGTLGHLRWTQWYVLMEDDFLGNSASFSLRLKSPILAIGSECGPRPCFFVSFLVSGRQTDCLPRYQSVI